jgi:hypothetical protein
LDFKTLEEPDESSEEENTPEILSTAMTKSEI